MLPKFINYSKVKSNKSHVIIILKGSKGVLIMVVLVRPMISLSLSKVNISYLIHIVPTGGDGVMSSFKPAASAKLYASPEDVKNVGYRSRSLPTHSSRPQVRMEGDFH